MNINEFNPQKSSKVESKEHYKNNLKANHRLKTKMESQKVSKIMPKIKVEVKDEINAEINSNINNNKKKKKINSKNATKIIEILYNYYPDAKCSLNFTTSFEMLAAVMLSAQCTDERVNLVTPNLFAKYDTPEGFKNADLKDIENLIHSCGFYKNKARNLKAAGQMITDKYNGNIPQNMNELIKIPGIGRKSANVIMLEAFNNPQGIAVDTHAKRISNRIGLSSEADPSKIEHDLTKLIPKKYWKDVNHLFIWHGRNLCTAQKPKCDICPVSQYCQYHQLFSSSSESSYSNS